MIEKLISILGLLFLIIFSVYAFHVIYMAWKYSKSDHTKDLELLESTKLTSLDIPIINRHKIALLIKIKHEKN